MSDLVVVMNKGRIEQMGPPAEVYEEPRSEFVASFLGNANFLPAVVREVRGDNIAVSLAGGDSLLVGGAARSVKASDAVRVMVRAEKITIAGQQAGGLMARIIDVDYLGAMARYQLELRNGDRLLSLASLGERTLATGETVTLLINPRHCRIL
ncbi:MAG TPA: TOBE domain-containing protein [Terriglobales bacterium]|nr:TOBE domain-containing protein [Terriglobales bacterium]